LMVWNLKYCQTVNQHLHQLY